MFGLSNKKTLIINIRLLAIIIVLGIFKCTFLIAQAETNNKIRCIVIDAGHGGKDPGARGSKHNEKDLALAIALKFGNHIKENLPDVKVIYTRDSDVFIPLQERTEIANKNQADVFISIHCNSNKSQIPYGTETYAMGLTKTEGNLEVAKRENSVILKEDNFSTKYEGFDNSPESYIMFSLMQNTHIDQSLILASDIQNQFKERINRNVRGVKQAGFLVLWKTAMPSVLVETGFISNPEEEKFLASSKGQDYISSSIFRAFRDYKNEIENKSIYVSNGYNNGKSIKTDSTNGKSIKKDSAGRKSSKTEFIKTPIPIKPSDSTNVEIYYAVQICSSKKPIALNSKIFKGYKNVEEHKMPDYYKYTLGKKSNLHDILEYSKPIRNAFPGAFIIALKDGKIVSAKEALNEIKN
jgi:N-acetylmuramoyl-L-alanine amidase